MPMLPLPQMLTVQINLIELKKKKFFVGIQTLVLNSIIPCTCN